MPTLFFSFFFLPHIVRDRSSVKDSLELGFFKLPFETVMSRLRHWVTFSKNLDQDFHRIISQPW